MSNDMGSITIGEVTATDTSHDSECGVVPVLNISRSFNLRGMDHGEVVRLRNWLSDWVGHHQANAERVSAYAKMVHEKADAAKLAEQTKEVEKVYGTSS